MNVIDMHTVPAETWKNGRGITRTIALFPPHATLETFDWRVSIAEVTASGEFSRFPGVDRTILLLDGAGMLLHIGNAPALPLTNLFEPHEFSGDHLVRSELLTGPVRDFNVMTRRHRAKSTVMIWQSQIQAQIAADVAIFFPARGACRLDSIDLALGQALRMDRPACEMSFLPQTPDAVTIAVLADLEYA